MSAVLRRGGLLLAAALAFGLSASGQGAPQSVQELAQRVDQHYNHLHSLKANFAESYQGLGMERSERGTLLLLKPGRMRWDYSFPAGKMFLLDGKYAWFYTRGDPQIQRVPAKAIDDLRSPLRLLLGHTQLTKELNHLTMGAGPDGTYTLTGEPKGQEARVSRLSLRVTADGTIVAIDIQETDGALTHFSFSGEQPNAAIPADAFHFAPPPGVPVIDEQSQ